MSSRQALIVVFKYGLPDLDPISALEVRLTEAIQAAGVGKYSGNVIAPDLSGGVLFMDGPDADALYAAVSPVLRSSAFMKGAECTRRYGSARDENVTIAKTVIA